MEIILLSQPPPRLYGLLPCLSKTGWDQKTQLTLEDTSELCHYGAGPQLEPAQNSHQSARLCVTVSWGSV